MSYVARRILLLLRNIEFRRLSSVFKKRWASREHYFILNSPLEQSISEDMADVGCYFRSATVADVASIIEAWPKDFGSASLSEMEIVITQRFVSGIPCFVAFDGHDLVGALWARQAQCPIRIRGAGDKSFEVVNWFVAPGKRGRGIGEALIRFAMAAMFVNGYTHIWSKHLIKRYKAALAIERAGLSPLGIIESGYRFGRSYQRTIHSPERASCLLVAGVAYGANLAVVRSLNSRGIDCHVAVTHGSALPYRASRHSRSVIDFGGICGSRLTEALLLWARFVAKRSESVLIPMTDLATDLICTKRSEFERYCRLSVPGCDLVSTFSIKQNANQKLSLMGADVPRCTVIEYGDNYRATLKAFRFPVILKPASQISRSFPFKALVCDDSFSALSTINKELADTREEHEALLVQEYIPGGDETIWVYLFYRSETGVVSAWTGKKLRQSPPGAGIMAMGKSERNSELMTLGFEIIRNLGYTGLGGLEFKLYDGKYWFIEMSTRLEGFHQLGIKSGVDLAWAAYSDLALTRPEAQSMTNVEAGYFNFQSYFKVIRNAGLTTFLNDFLSMLKYTERVWSVWSIRDPLPSLATFVVAINRVFRRKTSQE